MQIGCISVAVKGTEHGLWGRLDLGSTQKQVILPLGDLEQGIYSPKPRFPHMKKCDYSTYSAGW